MARDSWNEKLRDAKDLPRIVDIKGKMIKRFGRGKIVIPAPLEVDARMRRARHGRLLTIDMIRDSIANRHHAQAT